ncbi:hypothetical protein [Halopiger aswanensis]|uniref:hypothetical protein n=1 Tax=Halopiger aswanensis TaxID=148449 RepID=UPI0011C48C96|nr:hypothetical protein [Halopiger aswanensis]
MNKELAPAHSKRKPITPNGPALIVAAAKPVSVRIMGSRASEKRIRYASVLKTFPESASVSASAEAKVAINTESRLLAITSAILKRIRSMKFIIR